MNDHIVGSEHFDSREGSIDEESKLTYSVCQQILLLFKIKDLK